MPWGEEPSRRRRGKRAKPPRGGPGLVEDLLDGLLGVLGEGLLEQPASLKKPLTRPSMILGRAASESLPSSLAVSQQPCARARPSRGRWVAVSTDRAEGDVHRDIATDRGHPRNRVAICGRVGARLVGPDVRGLVRATRLISIFSPIVALAASTNSWTVWPSGRARQQVLRVRDLLPGRNLLCAETLALGVIQSPGGTSHEGANAVTGLGDDQAI